MRELRRPRAVTHARRQRALGVTGLLVLLGMYVAVLAAPVVGPAMTGLGPGEALHAVVVGVAVMFGLVGLAVLQ